MFSPISFKNETYSYNSTIIETSVLEKDINFKHEFLSFNFSQILPNRWYRLDYSETFRKLEDLWTGNRNITLLNEIRHLILELEFTSELEKELRDTNQTQYIPKIENWLFMNFTQYYFDIEINFTNPLNIS